MLNLILKVFESMKNIFEKNFIDQGYLIPDEL